MNKKYFSKLFNAFKIAGGCIIAIIVARLLGLEYAASAGIITILSIQETKKDTIKIALIRLVAFIVAILIATVAFKVMGQTLTAFGVYMFVYIIICVLNKWYAAMAVNSVLVTHLWTADAINFYWVKNESMLFVLGVGIGVLINLTLTANRDKIDELRKTIDSDVSRSLDGVACAMHGQSEELACLDDLKMHLKEAVKLTSEGARNAFRDDVQSDLEYILMRQEQSKVLSEIAENVVLLKSRPTQLDIIADFIDGLSEHISENNDVDVNLKELDDIIQGMKSEAMPVTRDEFESRAILYQIMFQVKEFLMCKKNYAASK